MGRSTNTLSAREALGRWGLSGRERARGVSSVSQRAVRLRVAQVRSIPGDQVQYFIASERKGCEKTCSSRASRTRSRRCWHGVRAQAEGYLISAQREPDRRKCTNVRSEHPKRRHGQLVAWFLGSLTTNAPVTTLESTTESPTLSRPGNLTQTVMVPRLAHRTHEE